LVVAFVGAFAGAVADAFAGDLAAAFVVDLVAAFAPALAGRLPLLPLFAGMIYPSCRSPDAGRARIRKASTALQSCAGRCA
jgi:hypothetical protein